MDKIFLHNMKIQTLIGVYEWERQNPQELVFDLDMGLNQAFVPDDELGATLDYAAVCGRLREHLATQAFLLLETLALESVRFLFAEFEVIYWVKIRIVKQGILPKVGQVGVELERFRGE